MEDDLPTEYDVIVVGTGMVESIVAAATSRCGKRVLHLDKNSYYGQLWATLNFEQFKNLLDSSSSNTEKAPLPSGFDDFVLLPLVSEVSKISGVFQEWYLAEEVQPELSNDETCSTSPSNDSPNGEEIMKLTKEELDSPQSAEIVKRQSRKFNIDLLPKIIYCQGPMVRLLIDSKVSRYMEFLNVSNVLALVDSVVCNVPCCKSDVFSSKELSVVDKRILMKQLEIVLNHSQEDSLLSQWKDSTFASYLKSKRLSDKLYHYILYGIAKSTENTPFNKALENLKEFLNNLGHYGGNSPFLWPLYGSGELLQAFCRLCAVYGGIYYLNKGADFIPVDAENQCKGVISSDKLLSSKYVVISASQLASDASKPHSYLTRAVLLTDSSLNGPNKKQGVSIMHLPFDGKLITITEISSNSGACPKGLFVVHVTCNSDYNHSSLLEVLKQIFSVGSLVASKPKVLYYAFYKIEDIRLYTYETYPSNLKICKGMDVEIDFEMAINEAKTVFQSMYPSESFLDPMPDPNEVDSLGSTDDCDQISEEVKDHSDVIEPAEG